MSNFEESFQRAMEAAASSGADMIHYVQVGKDGNVWRSGALPARNHREAVQGVLAGWLSGQPRWAETASGKFIYGLDAKGKEMAGAPDTSQLGRHGQTTFGKLPVGTKFEFLDMPLTLWVKSSARTRQSFHGRGTLTGATRFTEKASTPVIRKD